MKWHVRGYETDTNSSIDRTIEAPSRDAALQVLTKMHIVFDTLDPLEPPVVAAGPVLDYDRRADRASPTVAEPVTIPVASNVVPTKVRPVKWLALSPRFWLSPRGIAIAALLVLSSTLSLALWFRAPSLESFDHWVETKLAPTIDVHAGFGATKLIRSDIRTDSGSEANPRQYVALIGIGNPGITVDMSFTPPTHNSSGWRIYRATSSGQDVTSMFVADVEAANKRP